MAFEMSRYQFGPFDLDEEGELRKHGIRIRIQKQPFQVLRTLVERAGTMVSREDLRQTIWAGDTFVDFEHGLNAAVNKVRQALGDSSDRAHYIETIPGQGYRFVAQAQKQPGKTSVISSVGKEPEAPADAAPQAGFPRMGWFAAGVLAVATVIGITSWYRATGPVEQPLKHLVRLDVSLGPDAIPEATSTVVISPDGTRIVFRIRGADGKPLLATRLLDQATITPLAGTENGYAGFFSPDGQWIGFWADNKLKKVSLQGGGPVTISDASAFGGASWGANGDIVASLNIAGGLLIIPASGGSPHSVTNAGKQEINQLLPQVLPGGNTVLFTAQKASDLFDDANIEVVSLKNGTVKTLLSGAYFGRYLATNGSMGHLVYVRQGVLYAVPFDPARLEVRGMPEPILEDVTVPFDVSLSGTFVYRPRTAGIATDQKWPIVWLDSFGKTEPLVTTPDNYSDPQFSPDGARLAMAVYAGGYDIFVYDRQREALSRLTSGGKNFSPVWSPDGEHLVFESNSAAGSRLNWIRADGSGETHVLLESKNNSGPSSFSPDGRRLAYGELKPDGDVDLWTLPLDISDPEHPKPGKPAPFLQTPALEAWLVFSPDGRYVAYLSNESGGYEVYVRPAPGPDGKPGPGKWQVSTGGGIYPVWSPNGRELFYRSPDGRIMVTDYTAASGSFSSSKPRVWSDRPIRSVGAALNFALAPDGKHFAVFPLPEATAEDKGAVHVTFLLNFFDELRRKVPVGIN
jgi:serine/threonine-protein kinase